MQIPIVNQWTDCFSICTNGTNGTNGTNRQIVFARPHGLQVLMRCSLQMVYHSPEELTIRANGTNRKESLTNRNSLPMVRWYQWAPGIPPYSYLIHCENILSPLYEMHFTNGIPIDCLVSPLVPIVPLVPMDDRNPPVLLPDPLRKHSKSP